MAHIKSISFAHVGKKEGCLCEKCGQYITNIVTVHWTDGVNIDYGTECFDKLYHSGKLTDHGIKLMKKALNSIKNHTKQLEAYTSGKMNAENDNGWKWFKMEEEIYGNKTAWSGKTYEEYRQWMIDVWFPKRFEEDQKEIDRFAKVNFER